jgi:hypothetical protein
MMTDEEMNDWMRDLREGDDDDDIDSTITNGSFVRFNGPDQGSLFLVSEIQYSDTSSRADLKVTNMDTEQPCTITIDRKLIFKVFS